MASTSTAAILSSLEASQEKGTHLGGAHAPGAMRDVQVKALGRRARPSVRAACGAGDGVGEDCSQL